MLTILYVSVVLNDYEVAQIWAQCNYKSQSPSEAQFNVANIGQKYGEKYERSRNLHTVTMRQFVY